MKWKGTLREKANVVHIDIFSIDLVHCSIHYTNLHWTSKRFCTQMVWRPCCFAVYILTTLIENLVPLLKSSHKVPKKWKNTNLHWTSRRFCIQMVWRRCCIQSTHRLPLWCYRDPGWSQVQVAPVVNLQKIENQLEIFSFRTINC